MTGIVIILFNPTEEDIQNLSVLGDRYHGVTVDNSPNRSIDTDHIGLITYLFNGGKNLGIAEAQNQGVKRLMEDKDITHIVFLDQDSRVSPDYPDAIAQAFREASKGRKLAFLGPSVENMETGEEYKSVIHQDTPSDDGFVKRREVISSGGCTSVACLNDIGLNDEKLFIDYVDFDWCWRARSKGYECGITQNLCIRHHVGKKTFSIFGYLIIISAPPRYFYQYRNYLWLVRKKHVPLQWKIAMGIKKSARLIYFPLFIREGGKCWKYMVKGIYAGFRK